MKGKFVHFIQPPCRVQAYLQEIPRFTLGNFQAD
jgi:hypothetical protein